MKRRREIDVPHHPVTGMATVDWTLQTREEGRMEALVQDDYQCMANANLSFSYPLTYIERTRSPRLDLTLLAPNP